MRERLTNWFNVLCFVNYYSYSWGSSLNTTIFQFSTTLKVAY